MKENQTAQQAQQIEQLEIKLNLLAPRWRGAIDTAEAEALVHEYQAALRRMIQLGFRARLDMDAELPRDLMPHEYLDLFAKPEPAQPALEQRSERIAPVRGKSASAAKRSAATSRSKKVIRLHHHARKAGAKPYKLLLGRIKKRNMIS